MSEAAPPALRAAVVGHVEWVTFLRVDRLPVPGAIAHADEGFDEPAGGGGVAAVELARLCGGCALFTALGDDAVGRAAAARLGASGVDVRATWLPAPQRRAITLLDPAGERTIIVIGPGHGPIAATAPDLDALADMDAVYFCKGDAGALVAARRARVRVATARVLPVLQSAGVALDALVHSAHDAGERYATGDLDPPPRLVATTEGTAGGRYTTADGGSGRWRAAPLAGSMEDAYGAGDCFAAGLAFALASGLEPQAAVDFAATRGALALTRRGAGGV